METNVAIIDALGGASQMAGLLGISAQAVSNMKARDSIPPEYWATLVAEAGRRGIEGVTLEVLAGLAARRRKAVA